MAQQSKQKPKAAAPEPVTLAYQAPEKSKFDQISDRLVAAIAELNASIEAAHENAEMRVYLWCTGDGQKTPSQFKYSIYRLARTEISLSISVAEPDHKKMKHEGWEPVAGNPVDPMKSAFRPKA